MLFFLGFSLDILIVFFGFCLEGNLMPGYFCWGCLGGFSI